MYSRVAAYHAQQGHVLEAEADGPQRRGQRADRPRNRFPDDFIFGAATAAYQVEGAWDLDGKGESIWDHLLHSGGKITDDGGTGDVAADSYHKFREDVQLLKELNVDVYRFSISWPRILPAGGVDRVNQAGIDYYNKVIDELLAHGIKPMVTMYHWDLPQKLQDLGGWANPVLADYFVDYAELLFEKFGDRVKLWTTFNDPCTFAGGYQGADGKALAPRVDLPGVADYLLARTVLIAHARAFRLYSHRFRHVQKGRVGITLCCTWFEPATSSEEDQRAAETALQFELGLYAHPIFSREGDFPAVVKQQVEAHSKAEGRRRSRLPPLTSHEIAEIRGSADFLGLNHYTTLSVRAGESGRVPSMQHDSGAVTSHLESYPVSPAPWLRCIPWGFRKTLRWVSAQYPGCPIVITENGWGDAGDLQDDMRVTYFSAYLSELLHAINEDGVKVFGYIAWSLLDNLEWIFGYTVRFGLYHVDFEDPDRPRKARASAKFLAEVFRTKQLLPEHFKPSAVASDK
ncbi:myrosinase 1-like [Schistocerca americana]|uniref:myrosinase 1-like n=1 Tax=Schistocerca americana TaxID=7009 RepID=UPI001F4FD2C9|nr:myrosinase 1-like [Schistocerca americana]